MIDPNSPPPSLKEIALTTEVSQSPELDYFPPPPELDEIKRILAEEKDNSILMREFGWING